jgi:hypothetical protein
MHAVLRGAWSAAGHAVSSFRVSGMGPVLCCHPCVWCSHCAGRAASLPAWQGYSVREVGLQHCGVTCSCPLSLLSAARPPRPLPPRAQHCVNANPRIPQAWPSGLDLRPATPALATLLPTHTHTPTVSHQAPAPLFLLTYPPGMHVCFALHVRLPPGHLSVCCEWWWPVPPGRATGSFVAGPHRHAQDHIISLFASSLHKH